MRCFTDSSCYVHLCRVSPLPLLLFPPPPLSPSSHLTWAVGSHVPPGEDTWYCHQCLCHSCQGNTDHHPVPQLPQLSEQHPHPARAGRLCHAQNLHHVSRLLAHTSLIPPSPSHLTHISCSPHISLTPSLTSLAHLIHISHTLHSHLPHIFHTTHLSHTLHTSSSHPTPHTSPAQFTHISCTPLTHLTHFSRTPHSLLPHTSLTSPAHLTHISRTPHSHLLHTSVIQHICSHVYKDPPSH